jgi:hypothetical protein
MASYKHKAESPLVSMDDAKSCHEQFLPIFCLSLARQCRNKHARCKLIYVVENNHFNSYSHQQKLSLVFPQFITTQLSPSYTNNGTNCYLSSYKHPRHRRSCRKRKRDPLQAAASANYRGVQWMLGFA